MCVCACVHARIHSEMYKCDMSMCIYIYIEFYTLRFLDITEFFYANYSCLFMISNRREPVQSTTLRSQPIFDPYAVTLSPINTLKIQSEAEDKASLKNDSTELTTVSCNASKD